jgi:hypothetical protein
MPINWSKENIIARMSLPGSALQLAVFRIALGLQVFYSSSSELFALLQTVEGTKGTKTIFPALMDDWIAANAYPYMTIALQVLSALLVLGLFTRYILPVITTVFILAFGFWYSKFNAPVPWLYIWFPLLILSFTRCADRLSLDALFGFTKEEKDKTSVYRWPVEVVTAWYAYIYVAAGIAKILPFTKGLIWLDGATSQKIIYDRYLDSFLHYVVGKPLFDYTQYAWLFGVLSIGSLLIELACIVLFFTNRYNNWIIFLVGSMHLFLYLTGVPGFMQLALVLSICLLSPTLFERKTVM